MATSEEREQNLPLAGDPLDRTSTTACSSQPSLAQRILPKVHSSRHWPQYTRIPSAFWVAEGESQESETYDCGNLQVSGALSAGSQSGLSSPNRITQPETMTVKPPPLTCDITGEEMAIQNTPEQEQERDRLPMTAASGDIPFVGTSLHRMSSEPDLMNQGHDRSSEHLHPPHQTSQSSESGARSDVDPVSLRSEYSTFVYQYNCTSTKNYKSVKLSWRWIVILIMAAYGTAMSALFFVIAVTEPRYGRKIRTDGFLTISGAALLSTFLAKSIELSFVTLVIALLGQTLARRAHSKKGPNGITLAEIGMRSWILQPGTLVTHWESVRYAGVTVLGITSLISTILALLYVTAANALVQPQLKFITDQRTMRGFVMSSFANPEYIKQGCKTPITALIDPVDADTTCMQLAYAATAFHDFQTYLSTWEALSRSGNGTSDLQSRPKGYAMLNDNTTITALWIEQQYSNMSKLYETHGHIIVNVSMAMPHTGVVHSAIDPVNKIIQPQDLDGQGNYRISASVPSPVIYVTCAMLSKNDLRPVVATLSNHSLPESMVVPTLNTSDVYRGGTSLDDIFQWGPTYGEYNWPPVFAKLPLGYNTMINDTLRIPYGREAVYLLGNSTIESTPGAIESDPPVDTFIYPLCQIRVGQTPYCSTLYDASPKSATLTARCEDADDPMAYVKSLHNATSGRRFISREWPYIGGELFKSLGLNDGTINGNDSNSRILNQLVPKGPILDPSLPSIAEALALMAGSLLLTSVKDAPFTQFFNYTAPSNIISEGVYQYFNASIEAQEYASGGKAPYQRAFAIILFAVFAINLAALVYFATHRHWYVDISEPSNLFSLAINSPPSKELIGSCGGGPSGKQFRSLWKLQEDNGHVFMESADPSTGGKKLGMRRRGRLSEGLGIMMGSLRNTASGVSTANAR